MEVTASRALSPLPTVIHAVSASLRVRQNSIACSSGCAAKYQG
ncbi:hypothetical protein ACP3P6_07535 [Enterobacter mori]